MIASRFPPCYYKIVFILPKLVFIFQNWCLNASGISNSKKWHLKFYEMDPSSTPKASGRVTLFQKLGTFNCIHRI